MLNISSSALALMLSAIINPHPNISLLSDLFQEKQYASQSPLVTESFFDKLYTESDSYNLRHMLYHEAKTLNAEVINKVVTTLNCAKKYHVKHQPILTVIDYSLPSNQKRLWIFDLDKGKLLYNTYVGHGITSGGLLTEYFSNRNNSKASSIGVYLTEKAYVGREGMSMHLNGIDGKFNNNAANRYIVMHGGWYMDDNFIKKYGRSGRSWGCPALPSNLTSEIINTIKDGSLLVMYYPSERWFQESRFLNCEKPQYRISKKASESLEPVDVSKATRDTVLFAPLGREPAIMVMSTQEYKDAFNQNPPLDRMLRRRVLQQEYIALSTTEVEKLVSSGKNLDQLHFVIAVVRNHRGYYVTEMEFATQDKLDNINIQNHDNHNSKPKFVAKFISGKQMELSASNSFIRWLGL